MTPVAPTQSPRSSSPTAAYVLRAQNVDPAEELQVAGGVSDDEEGDLALVSLRDEPPRNGDYLVGLGAWLEFRELRADCRGAMRDGPAVEVRLDAGVPEGIEFGSADDEGIVVFGGAWRIAVVGAHSHYLRVIFTISYSSFLPEGVVTSTVSPFLRSMIACPTGDSLLMRSLAGSASAEPTIWYE